MNENQENIELETISRIIDEQSVNITDGENVPEICIEPAHDLPVIIENQIPNIQATNPVRFNTNKFNKNLINITGLGILFGIIFIFIYAIRRSLHITNDVENVYMSVYILLCILPVGLPGMYFIFNPNHLTTAIKNLPC